MTKKLTFIESQRTRLSDVESALARHQNSAVASENPAEEQRSRSNIPATIERRWDKLRQATQNLLRRVQDLRQRRVAPALAEKTLSRSEVMKFDAHTRSVSLERLETAPGLKNA